MQCLSVNDMIDVWDLEYSKKNSMPSKLLRLGGGDTGYGTLFFSFWGLVLIL